MADALLPGDTVINVPVSGRTG